MLFVQKKYNFFLRELKICLLKILIVIDLRRQILFRIKMTFVAFQAIGKIVTIHHLSHMTTNAVNRLYQPE